MLRCECGDLDRAELVTRLIGRVFFVLLSISVVIEHSLVRELLRDNQAMEVEVVTIVRMPSLYDSIGFVLKRTPRRVR